MEKKLFGNICFTRLVKALMLSYFLTMLMLLGLSFGLYKFDLSEKTVRIGILAVYIISPFAGGFAMGKNGEDKEIPEGIYAWNALFSATACNFSRDLPERAGGNADDDRLDPLWSRRNARWYGVLKGRRCNFCVDGIKGYGRYFYFLIRGKQLRQKEAYTIL